MWVTCVVGSRLVVPLFSFSRPPALIILATEICATHHLVLSLFLSEQIFGQILPEFGAGRSGGPQVFQTAGGDSLAQGHRLGPFGK